jgi:hypothetical protein
MYRLSVILSLVAFGQIAAVQAETRIEMQFHSYPSCKLIASEGEMLYVVAERSCIAFDCSPEHNPWREDAIDLPTEPNALAVQNGIVYAACPDGLHVLDYSDGNYFEHRAVATDLLDLGAVAVQGNIVGIAGYYGLFQLLDISQPDSLQELGSLQLPSEDVNGIWLQGNLAYLACGDAGLFVVDISNTQSPQLLSQFDTPGEARDVALSGNVAVVADRDAGIAFVDVSVPSNPVNIQQIACNQPAYDVAIAEGRVFVSSFYDGLTIYDLQTRQMIGSTPSEDYSVQVCVNGNRVYFADYWTGVHVVDVSDAANPMVTALVRELQDSKCVQVHANRVYSAGGRGGLNVYNLESGREGYNDNHMDTPGIVHDLQIDPETGIGYLADYWGLRIVQLQSGQDPVELSFFNTSCIVMNIAYHEGLLFIAGYTEGLVIVDVSDPYNPVLFGTCDTPGLAIGVDVQGNLAYVADDWAGLRVIDFSDPGHIHEVGFRDTCGSATDVVVRGSKAYVSDGGTGLLVMDISQVDSPEVVQLFHGGGWAVDVATGEDLVVVSDIYNGVTVYRRNGMDLLDSLATYSALYYPVGSAVDGNRIYVADDVRGMVALELDEYTGIVPNVNAEPMTLEVVNNVPNPFNPATRIQFETARSSVVSVRVFNMNGQLVRSLMNDFLPAGSHEVEFDGSNLASGSYVYEVRAGAEATCGRMLLVK